MLETDLLVDRRRLKRRLLAWRVGAIVAALAAVLLLVRPSRLPGTQHVARVNITGIIQDDRRLLEAVSALAADRTVPAVVVAIDSPGGTVGGGEGLYDALRRVAAAKPVVAVMRGTAASAGYMAALPASRIFAQESTLTGSIGVILETGEASGLLGRIGLSAEAITSGPLKDQPSFTRPLTPQGREYLHGLVMDMYDQFVAKVATNRHLDPGQVRELADGRAYTGRQARDLGLVDEIGGEPEAREWLAREKTVAVGLPIRDLQPRRSFYDRTVGAALSGLLGTVLPAGLTPGAWAIWQGTTPGG